MLLQLVAEDNYKFIHGDVTYLSNIRNSKRHKDYKRIQIMLLTLYTAKYQLIIEHAFGPIVSFLKLHKD